MGSIIYTYQPTKINSDFDNINAVQYIEELKTISVNTTLTEIIQNNMLENNTDK
jgi:hypothetical protein